MGGDSVDDRDFSDYFAARYDRVRRAAFLMCGDWHRADDLAQAAFIRLARSWRSVREPASLDGFVRTCLIRAAIDESRRPWRRERAVAAVADPPPTGGADEPTVHRLTVVEARRHAQQRPRAVLVCRFYEDLALRLAETDWFG